jgi:HEAT repeat protein
VNRPGAILLTLCLAAAAGCEADQVTLLTEQLASAENDARSNAARDLGALGAAAGPAIPSLIVVARDSQPGVRQAACRALGEIGVADPAALAALQDSLEDAESSVQLAAAFALVKLDPGGQAYIPVLIRTMRSGEGGTIVAVGQLGPQASWAVPALIDLLKDRRPGIRRLAAEALGRIGPTAEAVPALQRAAQDSDDRVRAAAAAALASKTAAAP